MADARRLHGAALVEALRESRARSWSLVDDLTDAQWQMPEQRGVNPVRWELAHLAWFAEFWVLRGPHHRAADGTARAWQPALHAGPDELFDSARLAHAARWRTPMPSRGQLVEMLQGQLAACVKALPASDDDAANYFHRLALFHEDMHAEAFAWLRAALGYEAPARLTLAPLAQAAPVVLRGGEFQLGRRTDEAGFVFDNEGPRCSATLRDFEIDATTVSAGRFLRFVEAGGYENPAYWPGAAGEWRARSDKPHPQRWRFDKATGWQTRWFDRWLPLDPDQPVIHVNAFEAEAYCLWAKRRLPSAAEWERAAEYIQWGHSVWEWTADAFQPYPGFTPGPYREYSAPWFGDHRELRGGAFATHARMHDPRYRNFFQPQRSDVFAGFRSVAL
ncbi:MAG: selenoneine synthase SenA [Burkholderiaceae bacterium]